MFEAFKVASHIITGTLEGLKDVFDELKGGIIPLFKAFRLLMERILQEVETDLKDKPKPKAKGKRKAA